MVALFPVKANPPHLGHILTLLRIKDDYDKIIISVLDVNLFITPKEVIKIFKKVFDHFPNKFHYFIHQYSFTTKTEFDYLPPYDIIVTANKKVYDNVKKHGINVKLIERTPYYRGEDIRKANHRKRYSSFPAFREFYRSWYD